MSSTMKLYQELVRMESQVFAKCESEYNRDMKVMSAKEKKIKFSYKAERDAIMYTLGYPAPGQASPVRPLKYHGKAVRSAGFAASQEENRAKRERDDKIKMMHRKLDMTIVQATCIQDTINTIKESCAKNRLINKNLLPKMSIQIAKVAELSDNPKDNYSISRDSSSVGHSSLISFSSFGKESLPSIPPGFVQKDGMVILKDAASACPVRFMKPVSNYGRGFEREKSSFDSKNRWTTEERDRLSTLYLDAEKPASSHPSSWNGFYKNLSRIFIVFFPRRGEQEVMAKIHEMVSRHAILEKGESAYWSKFKRNKEDDECESTEVGDKPFIPPGNIKREL